MRIFVFVLLGMGATAAAGEIELMLRPDHGPNARLEIHGLEPGLVKSLASRVVTRDQWRSIFPVFLGDAVPENLRDRPPMLGTYHVEEGTVSFRPRLPFLPGRTHIARFDIAGLFALLGMPYVGSVPRLEYRFSLPEPERRPTAEALAVYPSGNEVPANLLKCYIHFSAPMDRGHVYRHIALFDEKGERVPDPFLEIEQELWDEETRRLTLFFHPGRIKRGLVPNRDQGPALEPGKKYRLIIDRALRDASGNPMIRDFEKEIEVLPADRVSPDIRKWLLSPPGAGERGPLGIIFDEPLDEALLHRMLAVRDDQGRIVQGRTTVSRGETQWSFRPEVPWRAGRYHVVANPRLEDRAGNQLTRLFDEALRNGQPQTDDNPLILTFRVEEEP